MQYTIIPDDKIVQVDGVPKSPIDCAVDSTIHAIQWYGEFGEIEYKTQYGDGRISKPANEVFTDPTRFQNIIDAWNTWVDPNPPLTEEVIN